MELDERILEAIAELGFESPTPIQEQAIPALMTGGDLIGRARTGSGKTAAFGLPLLEMVKGGGGQVEALVLAPTRELAVQVAEALKSFSTNLPVKVLPIYGGASYTPQLRGLKRGVSVVVGTPGRVIDHMERGSLDLSNVRLLVLDEADEMLRMGFIEAVETVLEGLPDERQIALFSATMPKQIEAIAKRYLNDPAEISVKDQHVSSITQLYIRVPQRKKLAALTRVLLGMATESTLIFARTRNGCGEVADALVQAGIPADAIHGDLNQAARERVLAKFKAGHVRVLVATDVAARGIDISNIAHVINLDLPGDTETYVHRIGRTGRAGAEGTAITFVTPGEKRRMTMMQKQLKVKLKEIHAPGDKALDKLTRDSLLLDLQGALAAHRNVDEWVDQLTEEGVASAEEIAKAALELLWRQRAVKLEPIESPKPERKGRGDRKSMPSEDERQLLNEVEIFISIGRRAGINVGDIVGAIANDAKVPGSRIGRVSIFDHKCFVGVPREVADHLIKNHPVLVVRGKQASVRMSRNSGKGPAPKRGDRGAKRHGGDRPHKGKFNKGRGGRNSGGRGHR